MTKRVYTQYDREYQAQPEQVAKRVARNRARREMEREVGKEALKGKDVDHIKSLEGGGSKTAKSNLRLRSVKANRGDKTY